MAAPNKWLGPILDPVTIGPDGVRRSRSGIVFTDAQYVNAANSLMPAAAPKLSVRPSLPGVGGPADTATVKSVNAAAAKAAAAAIAPKPKIIAPTVGTTGSNVSNQNAEQQSPFSTQKELRKQAIAGLQGDIQSARQQFATTLAAQRAENKANRDILARYGQAVNAYLADAATRAGRDFETQAATQAILGAVGQGALQNRPMGTIFASYRPELGNAPLMTALGAQQAEQGAAIGSTLNQLLGTDAASRLLSEARGAEQSALASAAGQGATGQRLLSGLLKEQGAKISDLLAQKQQFETKVPSFIANRMQDLANAELQNYFKSQALGVQQDRLAASQSKDVVTALGNAATRAWQIYHGGKMTKNNKSYLPGQEPITDYQAAFNKMKAEYGDTLSTAQILEKMDAVPGWHVRGVNGRPFLSVIERNNLKKHINDGTLVNLPAETVDAAAFNPAAYQRIQSIPGISAFLSG